MPKKKKGSGEVAPHFKVSHKVTESKEFLGMKPAAQCLFYVLCRLRNRLSKGNNWTPDHTFWRTDSQLIKDTGLTRNTIKTARGELIEKKFIHFGEGSKRFGPTYTICDDVYRKEMDEYRDPDALKMDFHKWADL